MRTPDKKSKSKPFYAAQAPGTSAAIAGLRFRVWPLCREHSLRAARIRSMTFAGSEPQ